MRLLLNTGVPNGAGVLALFVAKQITRDEARHLVNGGRVGVTFYEALQFFREGVVTEEELRDLVDRWLKD